MQSGNESNLINDPDLDSYYVMDALVNKVPITLDTAGRVTSREIAMVASGRSTEAGRIQLAVDQGVLSSSVEGIHSGLKTAYTNTADPELRKSLAPPLALISGSSAALSLELTRAVHRGPDGTAATMFGKDAVVSAAALQARLAPALDGLLAARVDHLRSCARPPTPPGASPAAT